MTWRAISDHPDVVAPDGLDVYVLVASVRASMARFVLAAGRAGAAIRHQHVEELWFVESGNGEMWQAGEILELRPGVSVHVPPRTPFQVRATAAGPLSVLGVTIPPWPGPEEAELVAGPWDSPADARRP
jgi:mannose-6-phosphate isomerase-like protein (cupin superfamily)